jgi:hypothetical protein
MIPRDYDDQISGVRLTGGGEAWVPYELPDGRRVRVPASAAGRDVITYRVAGQDVPARRVCAFGGRS